MGKEGRGRLKQALKPKLWPTSLTITHWTAKQQEEKGHRREKCGKHGEKPSRRTWGKRMRDYRELKQQTFLSSRTSDCRGGLDWQRRFWREILMLSKTRSATQPALFCLYFVTGIFERWSFLLSIPRLKEVRNSLLIVHNSLLSDEELLLL